MGNPKITNTPVILLADDNPADQNLTKRSIHKSAVKCDLRIVSDGEELIDYLSNSEKHLSVHGFRKPSIIILDLNMPRMDGRQVLKVIKSNPGYSEIPVIVFSTSNHKKDISTSYRLGCSSFITKPADVHEFMDAIKEICSYWFNLVKLPDTQTN